MSFLNFEKLKLDLKPNFPSHRQHVHTNRLIKSKFEFRGGRDTFNSKSYLSFSGSKSFDPLKSNSLFGGSTTNSLDHINLASQQSRILRAATSVLSSRQTSPKQFTIPTIQTKIDKQSERSKNFQPVNKPNHILCSPTKEISKKVQINSVHFPDDINSESSHMSHTKLISASKSETFNDADDQSLDDVSLDSFSGLSPSHPASREGSRRKSTASRSNQLRSSVHMWYSNPVVKRYLQRKVRILIAVLRITRLAIQIEKNNHKEITESQLITDDVERIIQSSTSSYKENEFFFDKNMFKAKKHVEFSKTAQWILSLTPGKRSPESVRIVRQVLVRKLRTLAEYPIEIQNKICQSAYYQKVSAKRIVIRQSQRADHFYFIINGQAMVSKLDYEMHSGELINKFISVIGEGDSFGELAFIYNSTRNATVTSLTDLELISIDRDDYMEIFMTNKQEVPEHVKYLGELSFTKDWPIEIIRKIPSFCRIHYYRRGEVIVQNSKKCNYIFVVKSGVCQVLKDLKVVKPKTATQNTRYREYFDVEVFKPKIDTGIQRENTNFKEYQRNKTNILSKPSKPVFLQMQLLKSGEVFGLPFLKFDETDNDQPNPEVILVSLGAEIIILSADIFLKHSNTRVRDNVRNIRQNYPLTSKIQNKLQTHFDWALFKERTLTQLYNEQHTLRVLSSKASKRTV